MTWSTACPDWAQRLRDGRSLVPDLPLDLIEGERAVAVFNKLQLADVTGTPTMADAGGDWFRDIVRALFGSLNRATGQRMIQELFLLVPKKNSKTTNGALLMLTALLLNERPRAPFLLTAPVQKTADEAFSAIAGAIALDPVLDKKLHVREHLKAIVHRETKARLEVMTFDPAIITGRKVVGALIDELHILGKMPRAEKAMVQLRGGMQPFPEAFLATITTQSDEPPAGVFKDDLRRARAVRDGTRSFPLLPVLYEFPMEMQQDRDRPWREPKNWPMVTPNVGRSITIDRLVTACDDEEQKGEGPFRIWASQHLNIEIGLALQSDRWAGALHWERRAKCPGLTLKQLISRCEVIDIGIDGGGLDDLLGLSAVGRDRVTREWLAWTHAWAHVDVLQLRKSEASKLQDFVNDGDLTLVENIGEDVEQLADMVVLVHKAGLLDKIGVDQSGLGGIVEALVQKGVPFEKIVGISQGWRMTGAIKTTERKLAEGAMSHGGQALMNWCAANAKVVPAGNAILITKQASGTGKIDPLMATFNAVTLMSLNPQAVGNFDDFLKNPVHS